MVRMRRRRSRGNIGGGGIGRRGDEYEDGENSVIIEGLGRMEIIL